MASEPVHPLRIAKSNNPSPTKAPSSGTPRPLSEISPTEKRRNSPSWHLASPPKKMSINTDSSPFQSSPVESVTSPRMFWQNRNTENSLYGGRTGSPSPNRRSSIERLQKASRVKNSNILALEQKQEYDPTRLPQIERPLSKVQGNGFGLRSPGSDVASSDIFMSDSKTSYFNLSLAAKASPIEQDTPSPTTIPPVPGTPRTPSRDQMSPTKSSLSPSKFKSSFDPETGIWSVESSLVEHDVPSGHSLHRHAKSVTFDAAPPQINEYEMATPDLSSVGTNSREGSYESMEDDDEDDSILYDPARVGHHDDSFDASLEDTDKTPVVGPDDWRGESPFIHQTRQTPDYDQSPMPESIPSPSTPGRPSGHRRTDSANSNGEHRPLPPLPGVGLTRSHSNSSSRASPGLSATAERMLGSHRSLPSPPPASASKLEIQNIGNGKMSLEERLKLMMLSEDNSGKTAAEQQRERRLRRGLGKDRFSSPVSEPESTASFGEAREEDDTVGDISGLDDYQLPARISRESIMRRVNGNKGRESEADYNFSSPMPSSPNRGFTQSPQRQLPVDPDVPIPSTEDSILDDITENEDEEGSVIIRRDLAYSSDEDEDEDDVLDLYQHSEADADDFDSKLRQDDDNGSHYSDHEVHPQASETKAVTDEGVATPRAGTPAQAAESKHGLPSLTPDSQESTLSSELESFMTTHKPEEIRPAPALDAPVLEPPKITEAQAKLHRPYTPEQPMSKPEYDGSGWGEPEETEEENDDEEEEQEEEEEEPGTPDSVIHRPLPEEEAARDSPAIPEQLATIKSASGSKLKTRVSATPSDLAAMREARRQVSYEVPIVPPIPERHRSRLSRDMSTEQDDTSSDFLERHPSFKNRSLTLDLDLGLSLDKDFDRVIEAQKIATHYSIHPPVQATAFGQATKPVHVGGKVEPNANQTFYSQRGYLMRQNTKLVTASDKDADDLARKARSAGNSPIKKERPQSWTVEPWNPKPRQRSIRKRPVAGPVPPLPGHESNATTLNQVAEEETNLEVATPDSGERGRLFVKVMGVKDLDLPIPKNERSWFSLTLDNGVHCVTTAWLELARNAPIGQEFELVVPNDLEFQLTLNVKLEKPAPVRLPASPVKAAKPKTSTFSRLLASPKKRKEMELRQKEEEERFAREQRETLARQRKAAPTPYDLFSPLAADDGSFARAYVCLKEHESKCFGRPYMTEVACFNEWATEEAGFASSVKSKRGNTAVVRRAPYHIGKLELQLLFVPRPKNATDEDMPKSMNSCIRELKAAEERLARNWEGHLSQQGGDCPYWRRRYFKLVGTKLTAYHEATRQPRATINLSNCKRLIDDRPSLTEKETLGKGGKRRRSAFAEEEEGYMFVEEGFRIRFNNGEVIDFYADTAEDKDGWMKVLSEIIGRGDTGGDDDGMGPRSRAKWCEVVLKSEEQLRRRAEGRRVHSRTKSMYV
jgi:hypothetical protein